MIVGAFRHPFPDNLEFFGTNFLYSIIIIFCFGGMSLGFSSVFKKPRNANLIPVLIILFSFLLGIVIKQLLMFTPDGTASIYEEYQLYHFDVSYHMANTYVLLMNEISPGITEPWGFFLVMFGVYKMLPNWTVVQSNYYIPILSALMLVFFFGILLIIGGTIYFKKRDIS
jgi:ABC-type transport system involved in multi-copper enzyme maturation permease subunit